ncbi:L-serine ammonia-lyase, iron-sulfur-dependent, subunit alpha [Deferribacterales bacterium Es71-Z0220]|jgi:L-cysteine desulfidase|uniref:L-cysteine desulfidase family protein n=1 Tax=Deferrivibrio essentukiensis TaxID=2880922 RepID=UPI001F60D964|nr:L-serine ammonia-lyase, iron-sulfur-dependent, subunit alpha [Deferrivibrio essentukiensis]MCB4203982.1 L-serine ammonia-lyase, iron-sulfur-dependent, subunit alpha [Deferrivibrio essentukiensis]
MYSVKEILRMEVAPALGCTEPVAIALCSAAAASLLSDTENIKSIEVGLDPNLYKNALAVAIPGTNGKSGLNLAVALGIIIKNPELKLEILSLADDKVLKAAEELVKKGIIKVNLLNDKKGIYIDTKIITDVESSRAIIENYHNNITALYKNGEKIVNDSLLSEVKENKKSIAEMEKWLSSLDLDDLIDLLDDLDEEDYTFIKEGVDTNMALAEYGLKHGPGLGVGLAIERMVRQKLISKDMETDARIYTSSAADARMSGVSLPAMSSAGSGNHGLTAILPIWIVKKYVQVNEKEVYKAIALSHIVTAYIKSFTGRLSAVCGCSIAAGAGASAGIAYLLGGSQKHIGGAIKNVVQDLAGVICDGAKAGCSLKLATAGGSAVRSALLSLQGIIAQSSDGIIGGTAEDTMKNMGKISTEGMIDTDRTILNIMIEKQFNV